MVRMTHKHHLLPKYRGGSDDPSNLVEVTVTQHAMFHFCNWKLWGNKYDYLAWRGLTGEIPKEEIIQQLRREGSKRGLKASHARGSTPARRAAARASIPKALAAASTPEINKKRKESINRGIASLSDEEKKVRFSREQTPDSRRSKSNKLRSFKSLTVETPLGVVTVEGTLSEMAEALGIKRESMQPLLRRGKVKRLRLRLLSKNPW